MPEEINRILTDQIAELLLTPSPDADENLLAEGVAADRIHLVGNIMIDTLLKQLPLARERHPVSDFGLTPGAYALVTLHRPSNVDDPEQLSQIVTALERIAQDFRVLTPLHPRTSKRLKEFGLTFDRVEVTGPVGYLEMISLQESAAVVLTDSGGIQEETTVLGVPCLTLRSTTERPITITEGTNRLVPVRSAPTGGDRNGEGCGTEDPRREPPRDPRRGGFGARGEEGEPPRRARLGGGRRGLHPPRRRQARRG